MVRYTPQYRGLAYAGTAAEDAEGEIAVLQQAAGRLIMSTCRTRPQSERRLSVSHNQADICSVGTICTLSYLRKLFFGSHRAISGLLKAKLAKYRAQLLEPAKKGPAGEGSLQPRCAMVYSDASTGFDVMKVRLPSRFPGSADTLEEWRCSCLLARSA